MKLKNKFIVYSSAVHLIFVILVAQLVYLNDYLFFAGEILIIISFAVTIWLYRGISEPFNLIASGIESIKDKDFNTRLLLVGHQEMDELIEVYNQMIDRLREERIRQSEKNYFMEKLIHASPSGIILLDAHGIIRSINKAAATMLEISPEAAATGLKDLTGPLAAEIGNLNDGDSEIFTLNGMQIYKCQRAHFIDLGYAHSFVMIEELTNDIYKKEKGAYEKVIRMMSHETNNSIGAINSILNTFLGFENQLEADYRDDYKNAITVAVNRNIALSNVMSNFAKVVKIPQPVLESTDLNDVVRSAQRLMSAGHNEKPIKWQLNLAARPLMTQLDVPQIEQVLINIIKNSIESIQGQGMISIHTTVSPVTLKIKDNGSGISEEAAQKLFSPFFSTKKNGQGIGLTVIREVLINHGFRFSLSSHEGWTEFKIIFE